MSTDIYKERYTIIKTI